MTIYAPYNFGIEGVVDAAIKHPKITNTVIKTAATAAIKNTQKHGIGNTVKKINNIGKAINTGAKIVGGVATMAKTVGHGVATAGKAVGHGVATAGKAIGHGVAATGKAIGNVGKNMWYGGGDTLAKTALRTTVVNPIKETVAGVGGATRGFWDKFKQGDILGSIGGAVKGAWQSSRYQAKENHLLHALKNKFGDKYSPQELEAIAKQQVTNVADARGVTMGPMWMNKMRNQTMAYQGMQGSPFAGYTPYGGYFQFSQPTNFSYGVQVASNAIKGLKIGAGTGLIAGGTGLASKKIDAKTAALLAGGTSLLGAGIGAAKGAISEHRRHRKARKAGLDTDVNGIATIKDKDGNEYKISLQPDTGRVNGGAYMQERNLEHHAKSLKNRLNYYKKTKVDLPRGVKGKDMILINPKTADYDADAIKGITLHEVGHKQTQDLMHKHDKQYQNMRREEEAIADKYAIEHGADPKVMLALLEKQTRRDYSRNPKFANLPKEKQDAIVRRAIQNYRGDYLHKQAEKKLS